MGDASLMAAAVPSPCIDVCRLDAEGLCVGCRRTLNEIAEWSSAGEARQREILSDVARRKELVGKAPGR
jgi:predicted Fe-S protein YdhL (DUF1289 family)